MKFLIKIKDKNFQRRGMTFLELMVAIFVLTVGIAGTLALIHQTIAASSAAANRFKAAYLAQEGIEVVRNIRDENWINDRDWLAGLENRLCGEVVFNSTTIENCPGEVPQLLRFRDGFYSYDLAGVASIFSRKITLTSEVVTAMGETTRLRVEVTVFWSERGVEQRIVIVENLYNWR